MELSSKNFADKLREEACLIVSLSTQDMAPWDFFQGKGPLVTVGKVYNVLVYLISFRWLFFFFFFETICYNHFMTNVLYLLL